MGHLIDGRWVAADQLEPEFVRRETQFRNWITADGSAGPSGKGGFRAEAGRYHLYVSLACPWASRTLIFRSLKRLQNIVGLSVVHWQMAEDGWTFAPGENVIPDTVNGVAFLHELYTRADPAYSGRVSVPVLWDKRQNTIVSNESSEIIRMFNSAFDEVGASSGDYYPEPLRSEIDAVNARVYETVNNGVYEAGFARKQAAHEQAVKRLFATLDWLEGRLGKSRFLVGAKPTEADWRLFTTLIRFDPVYYVHFKCNLRRLVDYPNLWSYTRDLFHWPGIADTVNFDHIKRHYYGSMPTINPAGIVPLGPEIDLDAPHDRQAMTQ
jgi:putative glutathione S-transferase